MPSLYAAVAEGQAPLRLQVKAPAGTTAVLVGLKATGDNAVGTASRPSLSRPSTIGTGTDQTLEKRGYTTRTPTCTYLAAFSGAPSTPSLSSGAYNLPIHVQWSANSEEGIVVGTGGADGALLLYQVASGGHTISGELVIEEL